jgi:hypothetical protein
MIRGPIPKTHDSFAHRDRCGLSLSDTSPGYTIPSFFLEARQKWLENLHRIIPVSQWEAAMSACIKYPCFVVAFSLAIGAALQAADDPDPIKAKLNQAKLTYEKDLDKFRRAAIEHFDSREKVVVNDAEDADSVYQADLEKFRQAVKDHFDKREDLAREDGNKKLVDQVKAERKAFAEKGDLPETVPDTIKKMKTAVNAATEAADARKKVHEKIRQERKAFEERGELPTTFPVAIAKMATNARAKMEAAFELAVKEFTKARKDDEATVVENKLEEFKKNGGLLTDADLKELKRAAEDRAVEFAEKLRGGKAKRDSVDLSFKPVTDVDLKELKDLTNLATLVIRGTQITDAGLKELRDFTNLTTLDLDRTQITDAGLKELKDLKNLTRLSLAETQVTDAGLKELKDLKNLTWLSLYKTKVTDLGLKEIKDLKNLSRLDLRYTKVTDAGLKELKELKNLTDLDLGGINTKVTDEGLKEIKDLKNLSRLDLRYTKVTDAGLKELKELKNLTDLDLGETQITRSSRNPMGRKLLAIC